MTKSSLLRLVLLVPLMMLSNGFSRQPSSSKPAQHNQVVCRLSHPVNMSRSSSTKTSTSSMRWLPKWRPAEVKQTGLAIALAGALLLSSTAPAFAADFAKQDISGQDFSGKDLAGKDFTGVIAKNANFHNSNLAGCKFSKANLVRADFSGANVQGATFEDAVLDGSSFKDALAQKAIFSPSILDIGNLENVDLTDSIWPSTWLAITQYIITLALGDNNYELIFFYSCLSYLSILLGKFRIMICDMDELKGTNPVTGVASRDSILCTDYTRFS